MDRVAHEPLPVGAARGDARLTSPSSTMRPRSRSTRKSLPGCRRPRRSTRSAGMSSRPDLRAQHDEAVDGLHPAPGPQAVAVERGADDAPVGEGHRRRAVPGLHQAGVEGVEALQLLRAGPRGRGRPRGSSSSPRAAASGRRASAARARCRRSRSPSRRRLTTGRILGRSSPNSSLCELGLARAHPVDVAHHGVDLAVVADHAVGVRELPAREGVGGEARVHERHRALGSARRAGRGRSRRAGS